MNERQLTGHWRETLKSKGRSPRPREGRLRLLWTKFVYIGFFRLLVWGLALKPFPDSWPLLTMIATTLSLVHGFRLAGRGKEEFLLSLYGANDRALLEPTRRGLVFVSLWASIDATVFLGIWWWQGRLPGWLAAVGVPVFVVAVAAGPWILASVIPRGWWRAIATAGPLTLVILLIALGNSALPAPVAEGIFLLAGWASPAGWAVLMIRGLAEGRFIAGGLLILLAAGAVVAMRLARARDEAFLAELASGEMEIAENDSSTPQETTVFPAEERAAVSDPSGVTAVFQEFRDRDLLKLPGGVPAANRNWKMIAGTVALLLFLAVINRPKWEALGMSRHLALGFGMGFTVAVWLPLLGLPTWLGLGTISLSRLCPTFALFPIPLREVMRKLIVQDLWLALRRLPGLMILVFVVIEIAFRPSWTAALACPLTLGLAVLAFLPLRWFRLALGAQATRPFRAVGLFRGAMIVAMAVVFLVEVVMLIVFFYFNLGESLEPVGELPLLAVPVLVLALINAAAGLLGAKIAVRSCERGRYDLVRTPQGDGL